MEVQKLNWELTILDSAPTGMESYEALAAGDIDGDGEIETLCGGPGGLWWYRYSTGEKGLIAKDIHVSVGLTCFDVDGDGIVEPVAFQQAYGDQDKNMITWYKKVGDTWQANIIDADFPAVAHDIVFGDVDGDGQAELVTISCYNQFYGLYIYKQQEDAEKLWKCHVVEAFDAGEDTFYSEGVSIGDINGDGKMEIINGAYYFLMPEGGAYAGEWERVPYANDFREMCRTSLFDIAKNGRLDVVVTDSEYLDGKLSWFENLGTVDGKVQFKEHVLANDMYYSHSLEVYEEDGYTYIFVAEMEYGGWDPHFNHDAKILRYATNDNGKTFIKQYIYSNEGTHAATIADINGDGKMEVVGKTLGRYGMLPRVQYFAPVEKENIADRFEHHFLDRYKPAPGIDIMACDVNGDGLNDVVCGKWWYKAPNWERFDIPGINQVINCFDIDGDGIDELIAIKDAPGEEKSNFGCRFVMLKAIDAENGEWKEVLIGDGWGDWPHGSVVANFMPNGKPALVVAYHSANEGEPHYPHIYIPGDDPFKDNWEKKVIADIVYGEELAAYDMDGDGLLDIIAGKWWLKNNGDGTFKKVELFDNWFKCARLGIMDVDGDGRADIVMVEETLDYSTKTVHYGKMVWLKQPENPLEDEWEMNIIDTMRSPHSLSVVDADGDGQMEIVVAEHDPFYPFRNRGRAFIYKPVLGGKGFKRYLLDARFEHHDGMKAVDLIEGKVCILSHSWTESGYVHLWVEK